ncbi:MAG: prolipoprotein diacylglyceryl transferase [Candidatus Binatia bacterium]|nr:MAG: prolipoprotein diacylglyceryl transferase [Candidatus Binatia bacterium]
MYPVLWDFGPVKIYSYGAMMALGFLAAGYFTGLELERAGHRRELASTFLLWAAAGGLLGARVLSILNDWRSFLEEPLSFALSGAGFAWYGGFVGGTLAVTLAAKKYAVPWTTIVDAAAPGLALGHAIGRIGCELAGDGDWGKPTSLPWAHSYPNAIVGWEEWTRAAGLPQDVRVHPAPIYESLAYLFVFAVLWALRKRSLPPGARFSLYLVLASAFRFGIEFVRINPPVLLGLSQAQWISALLALTGLSSLAYLGRRRRAA